MKGHQPLKCKKDIETANLKSNQFLELGMTEKLCNCKDDCKYKK